MNTTRSINLTPPDSERLLHWIRGTEELPLNEWALEQFRYQYQRLPFYRRWCDSRGRNPDQVRDWTEIPAVPISIFRELEIWCRPEKPPEGWFQSSGTTGRDTARHVHDSESLRIYRASAVEGMQRSFLRNLPVEDCVVFSLTPHPSATPHSSLNTMFGWLGELTGNPPVHVGEVGLDGLWNLDPARLRHAWESVQGSKHPVIGLGTAYLWAWFLESVSRKDFPGGGFARILETGGYKGRTSALEPGHLHQKLSEWLEPGSGQLHGEYGMCEMSSQAWSPSITPGTAPCFFPPPWCPVRLIDPVTRKEVASGQPGLIQVLDLANRDSVSALLTEDLGRSVGQGFELLGRDPEAPSKGCSLLGGKAPSSV